MNPLGSTAFHPDFTPYQLALAAEQIDAVGQPEDAAEMREFAADFAAIQNLPEQRFTSTLNPRWTDYS